MTELKQDKQRNYDLESTLKAYKDLVSVCSSQTGEDITDTIKAQVQQVVKHILFPKKKFVTLDELVYLPTKSALLLL